MPRTLYARLALVLVALLAAVGIVYLVLSVSATRAWIDAVNQRLNRDLASNLVADRNLVQEGRLDEAALERTFHEYMVINPSIEIYLLDMDGEILAFSADPGKVKRRRVSLGPVYAFLSGDHDLPLLGDDPRSHDQRKAFSVTPVPSAEDPEGYLYVVLRGERWDGVDALIGASHFLRLGGIAVAGALAFGLLAGLLLFHLLTRRLRRLAALMDGFRASGFTDDVRWDAPHSRGGHDEIDQLGVTFDAMATRIREQLEALRRNDAQRREMIAHVSHDLRTPLAALHGHLETLQVKPGLGARAQEEHLASAVRQSERLGRLVAELFELATLDAPDYRPEREPFSVSELVQDVVQKLGPRASERGSAIETRLGDAAPLAEGDIALIERVLDNLIENGLDHTPGGAAVRVEVESHAGGVRVRVTDDGAGIPEEDLPRIFDRFWRGARRGSGAGSGHAGLGLAIAKRIVELHGSTLEVASRPGEGTAFSFVLPGRSGPA